MSRGSREDILLKCHDYFAAVGIRLRDEENKSMYAIICRSWKVRLSSGEFGIIKPDKDIFKFSD